MQRLLYIAILRYELLAYMSQLLTSRYFFLPYYNTFINYNPRTGSLLSSSCFLLGTAVHRVPSGTTHPRVTLKAAEYMKCIT